MTIMDYEINDKERVNNLSEKINRTQLKDSDYLAVCRAANEGIVLEVYRFDKPNSTVLFNYRDIKQGKFLIRISAEKDKDILRTKKRLEKLLNTTIVEEGKIK